MLISGRATPACGYECQVAKQPKKTPHREGQWKKDVKGQYTNYLPLFILKFPNLCVLGCVGGCVT